MKNYKSFGIVLGFLAVSFAFSAQAAYISTELDSVSTSVFSVPGPLNDVATIVFEVSITADEEDIFISPDVNHDEPTNETKNLIRYWQKLFGVWEPITETPVGSMVVTSTAELIDGNYKIDSGDTEEFIFTSTIDHSLQPLSNKFRSALKFIRWNQDNSTSEYMTEVLVGADYSTPVITIID